MLFSVVIPVYNGERYLGECLRSLESQSYEEFEVVIADDGSTDASGSIGDSFCSRHEDWRVLRGENTGPLLARRRGLANCHGEYAVFLDADDELRPDALEKLASCVVDTKADIVQFRFTRCPDFATKDGPELISREVCTGERYRHFMQAACGASINLLWDKAIRLSCFDLDASYGVYAGLKFGEDLFQLLPVIASANSVAFLDEALYFYRPNDVSTTASFKHSYIDDREFVSARLLEYGRSWGMEDKARHGIIVLYMRCLILLARHCEGKAAASELSDVADSLLRVCPEIEAALADERLDRRLAIQAALRGDLRSLRAIVCGLDFLANVTRVRKVPQ